MRRLRADRRARHLAPAALAPTSFQRLSSDEDPACRFKSPFNRPAFFGYASRLSPRVPAHAFACSRRRCVHSRRRGRRPARRRAVRWTAAASRRACSPRPATPSPTSPPAPARRSAPAETTCTLPAMTAGRYFVRAVATSTATAAGAAQQLTIVAGDQTAPAPARRTRRRPGRSAPSAPSTRGCVFTIVTDEPMAVTVVYLDAKATKDPAGPTAAASTRNPGPAR